MFKPVVFALLFMAQISVAAPAGKASCNARELQRQDCRLSHGSYKIRLLTETIARDDGTWHTVDPMPLKGEGVVWEKIRFEILGGRPILQLWLWDKGAGEALVQSLHWYTADAHQGPLQILAEGVVRRRRLKPAESEEAVAAAAGAGPAAVKKKPQYIYDAMEKHDLKALKDGSLEWSLGSGKDPVKKNLGKVKAHGI